MTAQGNARARLEDFGAILATDDPPALTFVDQIMARSLGLPESERWSSPRGHLSAPTEVHLLVTGRCHAGCPRCYVGATPQGPEQPLADVLRWVDRLAEAGVFHLALGGGESLLRDDLFAIAAHARRAGVVPNLTTSGLGMTREIAAQCRVFGQVNVSLDGLGERYLRSRGYRGDGIALRALRLLSQAGVSAGANFVVSRDTTIDDLEAGVDAVARAGGTEVEFLRLKPTGRAGATYLDDRLTPEQALTLMPRLRTLAAGFEAEGRAFRIKVDCSFVPLLCASSPSVAALQALGVVGCEAGNVLAAIAPTGAATACSFVPDALGTVDDLVDRWDTHPELQRWRRFADRAPEPCASCPYLRVCRGGCKAVTRYFGTDDQQPDPECPRVMAYRAAVGLPSDGCATPKEQAR